MSIGRPHVIDILKKFGENIDYLRVCGNDPADLIEAISLVPNVVHLELVLLPKDDQPKKKIRYDAQIFDELKLLRLKKLNIERANDEFLVIFNRLSAGVLVELTLHQNSIRYLTNLFGGQVNVKKLTIVKDHYDDPVEIGANLFDNLQVEFLHWRAESFKDKNIRSILAKQTSLKTLKLIDGKIDVHLMDIIMNQLSRLETLSISVSDIPIAAIRTMNKLVTKELTLQSDDEENIVQFEEFAKLDNSRVTTLNIQYVYDISDDLMKDIAESLPNLKAVSFHCDNNVKTFHAILKNFNYVEALHLDALDFEFDEAEGNCSTLMKSGCKNERLIELVISYPMLYPVKLINKIVKDYPHLKKLIILPTNDDFEEQCEAILKGCKEMESLSILRNPLTPHPLVRRIYNLNKIVKYGTNLNFIALLDYECTTFPKLRIGKKIKKKLGAIEYSWTGGLKMAVGRKTMKMNWEGLRRHHFLK